MAKLLLALLAMVTGAILGQTYISRLPNHAGYWLVHVDDRVGQPPTTRPRRIVVVVVDGLKRASAESMQSARRLAEHGQCRISDQGSYTVSRPVYSLLSTGLEVDRTGSRNNELTEPLAAESVWEVARRAGRRVRGSSHLPWWKQLFPNGFDEYRHTPEHEVNVFASTPESIDAAFDIDLFHPLYVDEAGHLFGGASKEYAAAVARVDREIGALLDHVDFDRDAVILTADHGHRDEGGHGGEGDVIRNVLACFAGANIQRSSDRARFDGRVTAPLIALLAGVPFPANMRAGEDNLDQLWSVAAVDREYERDRRAAIDRFRAENAKAIGSWSIVYVREGRKQWIRLALVGLVALGWLVRRRRDALWVAATIACLWIAHHVVLGDFDYTVINRREAFVPRAALTTALALGAGVGIHRLRPGSLVERFTTLVVLALILSFGHVLIYGWPLGFPLPPQPMRYFPFIMSFAQLGAGLALFIAFVSSPSPKPR